MGNRYFDIGKKVLSKDDLPVYKYQFEIKEDIVKMEFTINDKKEINYEKFKNAIYDIANNIKNMEKKNKKILVEFNKKG